MKGRALSFTQVALSLTRYGSADSVPRRSFATSAIRKRCVTYAFLSTADAYYLSAMNKFYSIPHKTNNICR